MTDANHPAAAPGWLPRGPEELFGPGALAEEAYGLLTVDVPDASWLAALETARDVLGCTFFDWLSAVDEPGTGFRVCAHLVALPAAPGDPVRRLLLRTTVPHEAPELPSATGLYAGAAWHERETHEMFGVRFAGHPHLLPLLLPENFEGHPLRKDFVLAARVAKAWPGAKEPGESGHGGPRRRQMLPPGVPDPNEWGPQKGQLPPVPSRPARGRAAGGGTAADRPARRARSASAGSASQRAAAPEGAQPPERPAPRRARGSADGSASQRRASGEPAGGPGSPAGAEPGGRGASSGPAEAPSAPRRARGSADGSASQRRASGEPAGGTGSPAGAEPQGPAGGEAPPPGDAPGRAGGRPVGSRPTRGGVRGTDAPWHDARPSRADGADRDGTGAGAEGTGTGTGAGADGASTGTGAGTDATGTGATGTDAAGADGTGTGTDATATGSPGSVPGDRPARDAERAPRPEPERRPEPSGGPESEPEAGPESGGGPGTEPEPGRRSGEQETEGEGDA